MSLNTVLKHKIGSSTGEIVFRIPITGSHKNKIKKLLGPPLGNLCTGTFFFLNVTTVDIILN
jgi:hypothetical protein